eukprot:scaffold67958_cov58-Cyclotella_meneghiniana.AAC.3
MCIGRTLQSTEESRRNSERELVKIKRLKAYDQSCPTRGQFLFLFKSHSIVSLLIEQLPRDLFNS